MARQCSQLAAVTVAPGAFVVAGQCCKVGGELCHRFLGVGREAVSAPDPDGVGRIAGLADLHLAAGEPVDPGLGNRVAYLARQLLRKGGPALGSPFSTYLAVRLRGGPAISPGRQRIPGVQVAW